MKRVAPRGRAWIETIEVLVVSIGDIAVAPGVDVWIEIPLIVVLSFYDACRVYVRVRVAKGRTSECAPTRRTIC